MLALTLDVSTIEAGSDPMTWFHSHSGLVFVGRQAAITWYLSLSR